MILGIRPEHLRLSPGSEGMSAQVVVTEPMGSEVQVLAKHGDEDVIVLFRERFQPAPGETLRLIPDPAHIHMFDAQTGRTLRV